MERRTWLWFPALAALTAAPLSAQVADFVPRAASGQDFDLSIRSIMRGAELVGQSPTGVRWSDDSEWIYFNWLPGGNDWYAQRERYRIPAEGGEPELVPEDQLERVGLITRGGFFPTVEDQVPALADGTVTKTMVLVGNAGPAMWAVFSRARDQATQQLSLDHWTREMLTPIAEALGAQLLFLVLAGDLWGRGTYV